MVRLSTIIFLLSFTNFLWGQNPSFEKTLRNNRKSYHIKTKEIENNLLVLTSVSDKQTKPIDTIDRTGLWYIKYPDFNKDGNADILINYYGNNSTYLLYLFDPGTNKFLEIENYAEFPDATQLKSDSKYYYSYQRAGCADKDWVSDLFIIENFKIIRVGHINAKGCDFRVEENPQTIDIYRISDNDETRQHLVARLAYLKFIPKFEAKWNFIDEYWNKNYQQFKKNYR